MPSMFRKGARVVGASALVTLLTLSFFAPAGAQSAATFSGTASGYGLRLVIDLTGLPQTVKAALDTNYATAYNALPQAVKDAKLAPATFPYVIDQYFLKSNSDASNTVTKAVSVLTDGTFPATADQILTADTVGQDKSKDTNSTSILKSTDLGVLSLAPTTADATVAALRASVASGPKVEGNNHLVKVSATLEQVAALLPAEVKTVVKGAVDTLNAKLDDATSTFNTTITGAAQAGATAAAGTPLSQLLTTAGVDLTNVAASLQLPNIDVADPLSAPGLATVTEVTSKATVQRVGEITSSDATSSIKSISALGGLVQTGLVNLSSHSEAAGLAGSSKNANACSIADVRIGGADGVSFDGKTIYVNNVAVPVPPAQADAVLAQVNAVRARMGIDYTFCGAAKAEANPDGTSSSQTVSALELWLNPRVPDPSEIAPADLAAFNTALSTLGLTAGAPVGIKVLIDPTVTTSVQTAAGSTTAPAQLPRTGAPALLSMICGLTLAAAGIGLRRKIR